jgi:hypothetical protein
MVEFRSEGRTTRKAIVAGVEVTITSYSVGAKFSCRVSEQSGHDVGRAIAATREAAETAALDNAEMALQMRNARESMKRTAEALKGPAAKK